MRKASDGELLARLFDGRKDAYGIGKGRIVRAEEDEAFSAERWNTLFEAHLRGALDADLGIYLVRDDNTVTYCCVDIDEPDFGLAVEVAETMPAENVWIEESRSGNFHCWVFFDAPLEAWAARAVLRGVIVAVGRPDLEIFPKGELRPGMVGNYASIPWHGEARPIVWGKSEGGPQKSYDRRAWLLAAGKLRTAAEEWRRRGKALGGRPRSEMRSEEFGTRNSLHRCASYIFEHRKDNPLTPGSRAVVLFNVAKQLANCRHWNEEESVQFVQAINEAGTDPVPLREVERFCHNAFEGGFTSTGCDQMSEWADPECGIANG